MRVVEADVKEQAAGAVVGVDVVEGDAVVVQAGLLGRRLGDGAVVGPGRELQLFGVDEVGGDRNRCDDEDGVGGDQRAAVAAGPVVVLMRAPP